MKCISCNALVINNVACHETGCPDSGLQLRGEFEGLYRYECADCGCDAYTEVRPSRGRICNTCAFGDPEC
jgi:hypothetical protein